MSDTDLYAEVCASHGGMTPLWRERLYAAGVPPEPVIFGWCGVLPCLAEGATFQPFDGGRDMVVVPVKVEDDFSPECSRPDEVIRYGDVVDIVAFDLEKPARWYQRTGGATWLGAVSPQILNPDPVAVWRHPLNWLRAGANGLVVLSPDHRTSRDVLLGLDKIMAEDARHAAQIKAMLERPFPIPPIYIPDPKQKKAA